MAIPLSEILDDGNQSMREQAADNNLPYEPFTMRELITPQYRVEDLDLGLETSAKTWENWVGQHDEGRPEVRPTNRKQLIAAVVQRAYEGGMVRAVGSGHSHSNAPAPEEAYIELNPGTPGDKDPDDDGLNEVLDHEGWLRDDVMFSPDDFVGGEFTLERVQSGIILRRLNRDVLHENGYALRNMGSFDGQTLAGAINTSTHGTGITLESLADSVRSVEIVTVPESASGDPIVKMYRIEPYNGVTDRDAFEAETGKHEMELIQDNDVFHSVVVGYGCMGVVYAYTMDAIPSYWLHEDAKLLAWGTLKEKLEDSTGDITESSIEDFLRKDGARHCQILLNTAAEQVPPDKIQTHEGGGGGGDHGEGEQHEAYQDPACLVVRHRIAPSREEPDDNWTLFDNRWPPERRWKPWRDLGKMFLKFHPFSKNHQKAKQIHNRFFHPIIDIDKAPFVDGGYESAWYVALRRLRDKGNKVADSNTSQYYHPKPPSPPTPTTEIGVPLENLVDAVDEFRQTVRDLTVSWGGEDREVFCPAPTGIRFTAASSHYLSPEHGRKTAMVELPIPLPHTSAGGLKPVPTFTQDEMRKQVVLPALTNVETHIRETLDQAEPDRSPRPHMGKHNTVDADWLDENYRYFDATSTADVETGWLQAYRRFNAFGTFDNAFTDQLGISRTPSQDVAVESVDSYIENGLLHHTFDVTNDGSVAIEDVTLAVDLTLSLPILGETVERTWDDISVSDIPVGGSDSVHLQVDSGWLRSALRIVENPLYPINAAVVPVEVEHVVEGNGMMLEVDTSVVKIDI